MARLDAPTPPKRRPPQAPREPAPQAPAPQAPTPQVSLKPSRRSKAARRRIAKRLNKAQRHLTRRTKQKARAQQRVDRLAQKLCTASTSPAQPATSQTRTPAPPQPSIDSGASKPTARGRIASWWHNASMPMAFSVYVLIYLVIALLGSLLSASYLSGIQDRISADAREIHGLYLYDPEGGLLVEARQIIRYTDDDPTNPLVLYVEDNHDNSPTSLLDPLTLGPSVQAHDLSHYPDQQDVPGAAFTLETGDSTLIAESNPSFGYLIACDAIPLYDQKARETWSLQTGEDIANLASGSNLGPAISPIGYYLQTLPSMEARIAETALGAAIVLVFPLWFGVCIYLAGRRFYAKRIKPAVTVFDAATAKIAEQDLDFTVTYDRTDEMGRLAASFETMRASLAHTQGILWRTAEERRHLNAAFAHDLRTPLTILHGKLELLQARVDSGTVDPEHLAQDCRTLLAQVERLELYVAAMSSVRRLEDRKISREPVNARALAQALDDAGTQLCHQAGLTFTWESTIPSDAQFLIDRAAVVEVIENLIGNAARYASSQVRARLVAEPDGSARPRYVVLTIEDDGPGFSADALAQALEPFFSESEAEGHFGLGLNMANLLCQKHDGTLELANLPDGGACVVARFGCSST